MAWLTVCAGVLAATLAVTAAASINSMVPSDPTALPLISKGTYWHNWADSDGVTHLTKCDFGNWTAKDLLPPSEPLYLSIFGTAANVQLANTPPGWQGPWHRDPVPQLVIFMSGQGLWRFQDGTTHVFSPGDVYFGNDQNATRGHESYTHGNASMILAMVQFPQWSTTMARPCWLK
jgi:hypothetical protein